MITGLQHQFPEHLVGYSDHTLPDDGMHTLITAYLLGALVLEKHFTFDKTLPGNDHYHAMDRDDLKNFVSRLRHVRQLLGDESEKKPIPTEAISRENARRSIVLKMDWPKDTTLDETQLKYTRPGTGISPSEWDHVLGRHTSRDLKDDHILQWDDLLDK